MITSIQASLQDRLDIAEHLFFKMLLTDSTINRDTVAEITATVGLDALSRHQSEAAVKWLERAVEQTQPLDTHQRASSCPKDLDTHIRHALGWGYDSSR